MVQNVIRLLWEGKSWRLWSIAGINGGLHVSTQWSIHSRSITVKIMVKRSTIDTIYLKSNRATGDIMLYGNNRNKRNAELQRTDPGTNDTVTYFGVYFPT